MSTSSGESETKAAKVVVMAMGQTIATLADVTDSTGFTALYSHQGLENIQGKIDFLKNKLGILATCSEYEETQEEELLGLEEYALMHPWSCGRLG